MSTKDDKTIESRAIERIVIGYILNNESLFTANIDLFSRDLFRSDLTCRKVFQAYRKMITEGEGVDIISISEKSKVDFSEVAEMFTAVDYKVDFRNAVQKLIHNTILIDLLFLAGSITKRIENNDDAISIMRDIRSFVQDNEISPMKRISPVGEHIQHMIQHILDREQNKVTGIRTGLTKWDEHTGGLQPSDMVIIAGETSQGKTSLALTMAYNSAVNHAGKIAIFSLEMSEMQLTARLSAMETGISSKKLLFYHVERYEFEKLTHMQHLPGAGIYIDDCTNSSIDYIISGIKIAHLQYGIQVAIVDYVQLVKDSTKQSDESEIASNTRRFKNIAKELNITVILLSQLKRSDNPKPTISRLRGSGQIEEAADIVAMIWRPEYYGIQQYDESPLPNTFGTAEIIIAKGRNYGIAKFWMNYDPRLTYFSDANYEVNNQSDGNAF